MGVWRVMAAVILAVAGVQAQFGSSVDLIEVYATVLDSHGAPVRGLTLDRFRVFEDGLPQQVDTFAVGEFPLTVVLGVDRSWSMAGRPLALAKQASQSFLGRLRAADHSMVLAIGTEVDEIAPVGWDRREQVAAVGAIAPWGTTALRDWLMTAFDRVEGGAGRQAIVLFTDGVDRYSQTPEAAVLDRARRSRALVYPITIGGGRQAWLTDLAAATGGRSVAVSDARALEPALASIAEELRYQYLLGYVPSGARSADDGGWRRIRVDVLNGTGLRVRARDGYDSRPRAPSPR